MRAPSPRNGAGGPARSRSGFASDLVPATSWPPGRSLRTAASFALDSPARRRRSAPARTCLVNHSRPGEARGGTINMLVSDRFRDFGEGATYQDTRLGAPRG